MGFLENVVAPQMPNTLPSDMGNGSFLSNVVQPTQIPQSPSQTPAPTQKPTFLEALKQGTVDAFKELGGAITDDFKTIPESFTSGIQQANQGSAEASPTTATPLQKLEGIGNFGAGVVTAGSAPLAPMYNFIPELVKYAAGGLEKTPYIQNTAKDLNAGYGSQLSPPERMLQGIQNISTVGTAALGGAELLRGAPEAPLEEPHGGTQTGTYPPATIRPDTVVGEPQVKGGFLDNVIKTSQENTQKVSNEATSGQREQSRLSNETQLQRAKDSGAIPADSTPETPTKIYRASTEPIKAGDHITLSEESAKNYSTKRGNAPIQTIEAPLKSLVKSDGVGNEFVYAPEVSKITKTASDINQNLVKQGFDALSSEQQSKFTEGSYKGSLENVKNMMDSNLEQVKEMARTGDNIPSDVHPQILFNAIEALATKEGDVGLLQDLAKSPLGTKLSESGATLGSHGFNDVENSTVRTLREVKEAREASAMKRGNIGKAKKSIAEDIKKEIKKVSPTKQTWSDFIDEIKCNY